MPGPRRATQPNPRYASPPRGTLLTVQLPNANYGIVVDDGIVVWAAPIGRWLVGWRINRVGWWVKNKGGRLS